LENIPLLRRSYGCAIGGYVIQEWGESPTLQAQQSGWNAAATRVCAAGKERAMSVSGLAKFPFTAPVVVWMAL
jgi:hypothetical protein